MKWETGKQTSVPEDMRAFLERDTDGMWWVYKTGPDGALLENFATYAGPFGSLPMAQDWTEKNVPLPQLRTKRLRVSSPSFGRVARPRPEVPPDDPMNGFDVEGFYAALDRARQGRSWRQVASEAGVSSSTLTRMSQGKHPDVDTFAKLVRWLGTSADPFGSGPQPTRSSEGPRPPWRRSRTWSAR